MDAIVWMPWLPGMSSARRIGVSEPHNQWMPSWLVAPKRSIVSRPGPNDPTTATKPSDVTSTWGW